jgi:hypothetical protein
MKPRVPNVFVIQWFDQVRQEPQYECFFHPSFAADGIIAKQIHAEGCTSREQAFRLGRWLVLHRGEWA